MTAEQKIRQLVEQVYKLDITSKCRQTAFVQARSIYYKMCLEYSILNQTRIAESIGKHHATVIHAMKQWEVLVRFFPGFKENYNFIKAAFIESKTFPQVEKRLSLDELLIKYNELLIKYDELSVKFEQLKGCDCGKCIL